MKRKIFMAIYDVDVDKGGINSVMFTRTHLFDNEKYSTALVTLDDKRNYPEIEAQLKADGRIAKSSQIINIYEYYRNKFTSDHIDEEILSRYQKNLQREEEGYHHQIEGDIARYFDNGRYVKYKRWDRDGRLVVVDHFSETRVRLYREYYHPDGYLMQKDTFHPSNNKVTQMQYFTKDGFCYLSRWFNHMKGNPQIILLFEPNQAKAKVFNSPLEFHTYFMEELCDAEAVKPFFICDGPGTCPKVKGISAGKAMRIYAIHTCHFLEPFKYGSEPKPGMKNIFYNNDEDAPIVVLTDYQKRDIERQFPERHWNIHVIPNVAEHELVEVEKHLNRVVVISRFDKVKRLDLLIRAFKKTVDEVPDAELHIYGNGAQEKELKQLIKDLDMKFNIKLLPYTTDVYTKMSEALFTVVTSIYEGQNLVVMEAMTQKVPTIAFDVNYFIPELTDHVTGLTVEDGDIDQLAAAMADWLYKPEKALEVGERAYEIANEKYTHQRQYENWVRLFEEEIAKHG